MSSKEQESSREDRGLLWKNPSCCPLHSCGERQTACKAILAEGHESRNQSSDSITPPLPRLENIFQGWFSRWIVSWEQRAYKPRGRGVSMHVKGKFAVCMNSSWFCIILVLGTFVANPANGYSFHTLLLQLALLEELKPRNPIIFCHSTALACAFLSGWCCASTNTTGEPSPTNAAEHITGGHLERKRLPLQNSAKQEAEPYDRHRLQLGPAMCKGAASALRFLYLVICLLCLCHVAFLLPECPHLFWSGSSAGPSGGWILVGGAV